MIRKLALKVVAMSLVLTAAGAGLAQNTRPIAPPGYAILAEEAKRLTGNKLRVESLIRQLLTDARAHNQKGQEMLTAHRQRMATLQARMNEIQSRKPGVNLGDSLGKLFRDFGRVQSQIAEEKRDFQRRKALWEYDQTTLNRRKNMLLVEVSIYNEQLRAYNAKREKYLRDLKK